MDRTLELATDSAEETRAVGRAVAPLLGSGDVVSLTGDLGAGKTTFVQGAASGLEVHEPVLSPTFTLLREYQGTFRVYHLDVYRLDRLQDVLDLGFEEVLDRGGIVFVEWGDVIDALLPESHLQVEIDLAAQDQGLVEEESARRLLVSASGEAWDGRWPRLVEATERWRPARPDSVGGAE
jgi:tRNA threonylcarbamoyladenosine biosynthesis protein TsaE